MAGEDFQRLMDGIITPTDERNLLCDEEVHSSTSHMIRRGKRKTVRTSTGSMTETQLALTCRTNQTHQTRDIRDEQEHELCMRRRKLQSAQTDQGRRKATISCQTHLSAEPIKASECQTPLPAQKDTSRKGHHLSRRLLHVSYHQAVLEAICNHPSDTRSLVHRAIRTATHQLATIIQLMATFVKTHCNAASASPRLAGSPTLLLNRAGQRPDSSKGAVTQ